MILSISGKIGSGKDTTGKIMQILIDCPHFDNNAVKVFLKREIIKPSFTIEKWGGVLKDMVCLLTNCTREELENEEFKNKELGKEWNCYIFNNGKKEELTLNYDIAKTLSADKRIISRILTRRLLLQLLGTECGRNIIHPNIWVNALMSEYKSAYVQHKDIEDVEHKQYPNWIITDTRFPNELQAVKDKGGINIRVNRPKERELILRNATSIIDTRKTLEPEHKSETALNNATFDYVINNDSDIETLIKKVRLILEKENIL